MSVKMIGLIWDTPLPRDQKFILLAYADFADHDGESIWPSKDKIERMTGYSRRSVQTITSELVEQSILIVVGRHGPPPRETIEYRLNVELLRGANSAPLQFGAQKTTSLGRKKQHSRGANFAPNPSIEPSVEPSVSIGPKDGDLFNGKETPKPSLPPPLDTAEISEAWEGFKAMRVKKKKPMTDLAQKQILHDLRAWGPEKALASLLASVRSGWTDVYEPKPKPGAQQPQPQTPRKITKANML